MNPTEPEKEINRIERELDAINPPAGKPPIKRGGEAVRPEKNKLLKRAWTQIKDDVDETGIDRLELLSWSIQTLMAAAGQAKQQKNPGAVVACIKQLDWMTGLGINSTAGQRVSRGRR